MSGNPKRKKKEYTVKINDVRFEGSNAILLLEVRTEGFVTNTSYIIPVSDFEKMSEEEIADKVKEYVRKKVVKVKEIKGKKITVEV